MVAIEEELVAGESPDKSVDEGTSGAAESSEGRDPRVSVFRPRDPEDGSGRSAGSTARDRDPLREAVAAWVATAEPSEGEPDEAAPGGETEIFKALPEDAADGVDAVDAADAVGSAARGEGGGRDAAAGSDVGVDAGVGAGADSGSGSGSASGSDGAKGRSGAAGGPSVERAAGPADSDRTAVFRVPTPPAGVAEKPAAADSDSDSASASGAASRIASAAGSGGPVKDSGSAAEDASGEAGAADGPVAGSAGEPAASDRTTAFRAVKPAAAAEPSGPAEPAAPAKRAEPAAPVDSERTAVFRAVKPGSADGSASAIEPGDSERTAVFRAVKPPVPVEPSAPAADEPVDSERTAVFRALKPDSPRPGTSKEVTPGAVGGERASTFVPLRTDDAPARPAAGQPARTAPAGSGAGTGTRTGAPKPTPASMPAPAPKPTPAPTSTPASKPPRPTPASMHSPERTTQQPLPPKPPLDMLADLTNNPPPPPSAMRTTLRRFKIYAPIVALLAVVLAVVQLVRPLPEPVLKMTAKGSYTFDGAAPSLPWPKEGQAYMAAAGLGPVGTFGEQKPVAIGSVAKAMTAYVILKDFPLKKGEKGPMIPIDKTAVDDGKKETEGESTVSTLKEGDKISEYDALAAIMIPSANNVARLLARWDSAGAGQEAFVKKMNDAAKELGMTNTTYTDPSGLDATTVSTAEDQVKLGLKIVEMPELLAITKLPNWTDPSGKPWRNYNTLIPFNGSVGIKTGSTTKAGGNLLFAAEKKVGKTNQLIVGAVLGQHGVPILDTAIAASKDVMLATQKMLTAAAVVKKGDVVGYVDDGLGGRVPVVATADVEAVGWPTLTVAVKLGDGAAKIPQTAKAGSEIGMLTIGEGASQVKVPVALQSDLAAPGIAEKLTRVG
ncbi:hypothetical protein [Streptomyces sp. ISL-66]|uniref:D-alanyl-D-alanine carboxypeptidase n=1 Tax=Streptomyces sp. ISL-66 TaxID=2819186 RepID=UPI0027E59E01|nr:hypothetical protein [Streptomyces sp. ISL-66]